MNNQRYTCDCDPNRARKEGDTYTSPRQKILDLPAWSKARKARLQQGHPANVCIDGCIAEAIECLWDRGIETTGCCCGHNYMRAWVGVHPDDYVAMHELGYEQRPIEITDQGYAMGVYTFFL